jgi:membrane associated rhomboid family serine protease
MIIVFPYGHDQLKISRLPFATMAIISICIIVYFPASSAFDADEKEEAAAGQKVDKYKENHKYIKLPDDMVTKMPEDFQFVYARRQEWIRWYRESPEEVNDFLGDWVKTAGRGPSDISGPLEDLAKDLRSMPGLHAVRARKDVGGNYKAAAVSSEAKAAFLLDLRGTSMAELDEQQGEFDRLYLKYKKNLQSSSLDRFAFIPTRPSLLGVIAHQFIHTRLFYLIFNMLFFWLAAVKLEDLWSRPVFIAVFLFCGIVGALTHMTMHPESAVPYIGASGAVAGMMGACLIRLAKTKIQFFYAYWFFSVSPKVGTFKAPAFMMLSLWLIGEFFSAAFFGSEAGAYWSHIGGFAAGAAIAVVFKIIRFEQVVLGVEPEISAGPEKEPISAFQRQRPKLSASGGANVKPASKAAAAPKKRVSSDRGDFAPGPLKEDKLDEGIFIPGLSDIDLPVGDSPGSDSVPRLSEIDLPPLDEMDQDDISLGASSPDAPTKDNTTEGVPDAEPGVPEELVLSSTDTSTLDRLAEEAFKSELTGDTSPEPKQATSDIPSVDHADSKPPSSIPDDLTPLAFLPTMSVPARETTEKEKDEEFHIELPSPISLSGLEGRPIPTKPTQTTIREVELLKIREDGLSVAMYGSGSFMIPAEEIRYIAIGRIENVDKAGAQKFFTSGIVPKEPTLVITAIKRKITGQERDVILCYAMEDSKLRYDKLMRSTFATRHRNFIALTKIMLRFYKNAEYMPCPGAVGDNNLPIYNDVDEFFGYIEKYAGQHP